MNDFSALLDMALINCPNCGISFGLPQHYLHNKTRLHSFFSCPNGHQIHPVSSIKPEPAKAEEKIVVKEERSITITKPPEIISHLKQVFNAKGIRRPNAGNCPECGQYFTNLSAHILKTHL